MQLKNINREIYDSWFDEITTAISITSRGREKHFNKDEISELLKATPTTAWTAGEPVFLGNGQKVFNYSSWGLSTDWERITIDLQIEKLLSLCTKDMNAWKEINQAYDCDIGIGANMFSQHKGTNISSSILKELAERGLGIDLCVYYYEEEEKS
ncbi:MAG: DUF4279 domain-containing protein [Alphaproteobacteria bacterium]|nr:DUF4279 domain-containing protein [Alphaproteobacteria bacterium]MCB9974770.1 DUF4279 domain-containing protein [Rhodospirillales bacterium]